MTITDIGAAKAERAVDAGDTNPRDILRALADRIDRGEVSMAGVVIIYEDEDGSINQAAGGERVANMVQAVGLLEMGKTLFIMQF